MKIIRPRLALAAIALIVSAWPALAEERVTFDGTAVSLVLPDNFAPMPNGQPGYMDMTSVAGVSAMQAPAALYEQLEPADLLQKQLEVIKQLGIQGEAAAETLVIAGRTYTVISTKMEMAGMPTSMWMVISDRESAFMLSFFQMTLPNGATAALDRDTVLELLATAEVGAPLSFDELAAEMGLAVTPASPFEFNSVMGPMIMLHVQKDPAADMGAPNIMISRPPFSTGVPVDEVAMHQLNALGENSIEDLVVTTFGGVEGKRLSGKIERNGVMETFVMYFARVNDAPLVFMASGTPERMDAATIEVIDSIAKSVKRMEN
jgi:hypothetical protein